MKAYCPACGLRCVLRVNVDCIECPEHGVISAYVYHRAHGLAQWKALIEIRGWQLQQEVKGAFEVLRREIDNGPLRIRVPFPF